MLPVSPTSLIKWSSSNGLYGFPAASRMPIHHERHCKQSIPSSSIAPVEKACGCGRHLTLLLQASVTYCT